VVGQEVDFGLKVKKVYQNNLEDWLIIKGKAHIYLDGKNKKLNKKFIYYKSGYNQFYGKSMETLSGFNFEKLFFDEVFLIKNQKFHDNRGLFFESFRKDILYKKVNFEVVQENISISKKNVIRGMHFQKFTYAQSKLIKVLKGQILDIFIDLRKNSKTYKKWFKYKLDSDKYEQIFIPKGFAHGFLALTNDVLVSYKVDHYYDPDSERSIAWNDPIIGIDWKITKPKLSNKDANAKNILEMEKEFEF